MHYLERNNFHLKLIFKVDKFPVVFTRTANVYGPQNNYIELSQNNSFFYKNKNLQLHGGGRSFRSFIHIDDVFNALYLILKNGKVGEISHFN